jgi:drug/metabolite transporter (DMT)-like permease
MLASTIAWSTGSFLSNKVTLPRDPFVATAWEMALGGTLLMVGAAPFGEYGELGAATLSTDSVLAWSYLVVFGSLVGFSAYAWLLRVAPISLVVTHQFVNPLVAIALGVVFLGERPSVWTLAGAALIIGAVYVSVKAEFPRKASRSATAVPRGTPADQTA